MKKSIKKGITTFAMSALAVSMVTPLTVSASQVITQNGSVYEATLKQGGLGEEFIARFDPETLLVSTYTLDGVFQYSRQVKGMSDFEAMVQANKEASEPNSRNSNSRVSSSNGFIIDRSAGTVTLYDENGKEVVSQLTDDFLSTIPQRHDVAENSIIELKFVSAVDGSDFIGKFDPSTGIAEFLNSDGELKFTRQLEDEAAFNALQTTNKTAIKRIIDTDSRVSSSNGFIIDRANNTVTHFDASGKEIVSNLDDMNLGLNDMEPRFAIMSYDEYVPYASNPRNGRLFNGRSYTSSGNQRYVSLWTYYYPSGMNTLDTYITNDIGDDYGYYYDVYAYREAYHQMRYPGENYGAWIGSFDGSFYNIQLGFRAD